MKYLILIIVSALALVGCATGNLEYYKSVEALAASNSAAEVARYQALGKLAEGNDPASKALAAVALGGFNGHPKDAIQIAPPRNGWDTFIAVSQVWASPLTNIWATRKNADVAITQSNNATALGISTNQTFGGMGNSIGNAGVAGNAALVTVAGLIQAPAANITTTLSGTGTMGAGGYTTNANPTLSGTGTLGSGAYSTVDTHSTDNHTVTPTPVVVITPVTPTVPVVVVPPVTPTVPVIVNQPVVVTPSTKVCTTTDGVTTCI